jgi:hypothetical protein
MRGFSGFLFEALFPALVTLLFALGIFVAIRRSWRNRHEWAERPPARTRDVFKEILGLTAFLLFIAVMLTVAYSRFQFHHGLRGCGQRTYRRSILRHIGSATHPRSRWWFKISTPASGTP